MKTKYIKIYTEQQACESCNGKGHIWEKLYHNQYRKCICYKCNGTRKLTIERHTDVTTEIEAMIEKIITLNMQLS